MIQPEGVSHNRDMPLIVPIAHDFICPWCWVGLLQAQRLKEELGVQLEWRGFELFPDELEWPDYPSAPESLSNRPPTPSRLDFLLAADGIEMPKSNRPKKMRTHLAHEAVEFAKTLGKADALIDALYGAYWLAGVNINDLETLVDLAGPILGHTEALKLAIVERKYKHNIVGFDDDAYEKGVYNVPTFFIGGARLAEQPYSVLRKAVVEAQTEGEWIHIYSDIQFPLATEERPYVFIDMVATIDGKILSGLRGESVSDLGSETDHRIMRRLASASDGVMIGGGTLRATGPKWGPRTGKRFVVSNSGHLPYESEFFQGDCYVATSGSSSFAVPSPAKILRAGSSTVDFKMLLTRIRGLGVERLLVLGGSELNGNLLRSDLVDELFLTIAPKVKLGEAIPTYAGGEPLSRGSLKNFSLIEHHAVEDEVFLRYRRERKK
jgi:riboflavin biosynthesis pyrimidine reductase/predicted DsbA family dithiol-disulfide isomerase